MQGIKTLPLEFTDTNNRHWVCPSCKKERLILEKDTLTTGETADSVRARRGDDFYPEDMSGRFACLFACHGCKEKVAVAGTLHWRYESHWDNEVGEIEEIVEFYRPRYFSDAPPLFDVPGKAPKEVKEELASAFQLFWLNEEACGNRIRSSVEQLLTCNGVPKAEMIKKGTKRKRNALTLHRRIERFSKKWPDLAEQLLAIKWIGNAGSHASGLEIDDLKDGFLLLEHVLKELYDSSRRDTLKIARTVNQKKKPRSALKSRKR